MSTARPRIRIVLSKAEPTLDRLGRELAARLPGVDLGDAPDALADINYYLPISDQSALAPTRVVGWVPADAARGQSLAGDLDLAICGDPSARDALVQAGVAGALVIVPGLEQGCLVAEVRIGVAGQAGGVLPDMAGIVWQPLDAELTGSALMSACRELDYLLVADASAQGSALAAAAFAVGTSIIASDAAGLDALAPTVFQAGDANALRAVLSDCIGAAQARVHDSEDRSWAACADAHMRAFESLIARGEAGQTDGATAPAFQGPVALLLHGAEHKALGGPTVRVPQTAQALRALGVAAQAGPYTGAADIDADLVHLFNVWDPHSALLALQQLKAAGKRVVFSPIYLDLRAIGFWQGQLPDLPLDDLAALDATYRQALAHLGGRGRLAEPVAGYNAMVKAMLDLADHVIFLSQAERDGLAELGAVVEDARASLVPNPVDAALWQTGDADLFRETYLKDLSGPQDYVLCVGRIEERKNQLLLAHALRDLPVRLVLVGHAGNPAYAESVRRAAGPDFLIVDRLDPAGEMLRSAVAGARVFCLPSWSEGASLAALEAAAAGAQMVLGERSSERSYFGDLVTYCDVGDPRSIEKAIESCLNKTTAEVTAQAQALQTKVAEDYNWQAHATATAQAYARAVRAEPRAAVPVRSGLRAAQVRGRIVFDLSTLAQSAMGGTVAQTSALLADALRRASGDVQFICWNAQIRRFIDVPVAAVANSVSVRRYCAQFDDRLQTPGASLESDCTVVVAGDCWQQDADYLFGLEDLKARSGCALVPLIHSLDPLASPFGYPPEVAVAFGQQFHRLARLADGLVPVSQWTAQQTALFAQRVLAEVPQITPLRMGDPVAVPPTPDAPAAQCLGFGKRRYVLVAGPVAARANLDLLIRVWTRFAQTGRHEDLHLVIAGNVDWSGRDVPDRIARDPRIAHRVHILSGLDAGDLGWLVRNCLFTVFAAHDTDRAWPVLESLAYAKPCIATRAGAAQEIASDLVEYIDAEDFPGWLAAISRYADSPALRHARSREIEECYSAVTWGDTAKALIDILQAPRAVKLAVPVFAGARINTGPQGGVLQALFTRGWHPREAGGRWACAARSHVTINLDAQASAGAQAPVMLLVQLNLCDGDDGAPLVIRANDLTLYNGPVWGGSATAPCDIVVSVPVGALDDQGCVTLTFDRPLTWENSDDETPARQVGIGLETIVVLDPALCNPLQALRAPDFWSTADGPVLINMGDPAQRAVLGAAHDFSPAWGLGGRSGGCDIVVPVLPAPVAQMLRIICRPVASKAHPVVAEFFWNNRSVAQERWSDDRTVCVEIALSVQDMLASAPHVLTVRSDSVLMPVDLGLGYSDVIAGVGIFDIELVPEAITP